MRRIPSFQLSYETLLAGLQSQKSDGYSLGMSILSLFICEHPYVSLPIFREVIRKIQIGEADDFELMKIIMRLMENNMCPPLHRSPLFKSLLTIEGGKFQPIHSCLNEVFIGLTQINEDYRMSVHQARLKVQTIKYLLPKIGEGFELPSIDDIICSHLISYGEPHSLISESSSRSSSSYEKLNIPSKSSFHSTSSESEDKKDQK
ncbi:hypothetical protein ADUPG1_010370 [Aduncisulcus paluster]|uniref:Protein kinase domain-containing protein n=1 Tax=Aduncisulcus paluster TaxID=2918883 RepID=A0ABQ5JVS9_9EUKA|nr:hypothetical protein ADUPG1_010370 [Aduncisulcus paluster]